MMDFATTSLTDPSGLQLRWSNCHPVQTARVETISRLTPALRPIGGSLALGSI